MALQRFGKDKKQGRPAHPPVPNMPDDPFRSPFTDQREDAADNWARPAPGAQPSAQMPPFRQAYHTTASVPPASYNWQNQGYHMEDTPADFAAVLNEESDRGYQTPDAPDWHEDPFRDNAEDPALRVSRSPELENRSGPFFSGSMEAKQKTGRMPSAGQAGSRVWLWLSLLLVVLVVIGGVVYSTALRITDISVEGAQIVPAEEVIRLSGIRKGANVLSLDNHLIEQGIESNPYLVFTGVKTISPREIIICVREREPAAFLNYCGICYVIDNKGHVLAESDDTEHPPALMRLEGLEVKRAAPGSRILVLNEEQLNLYVNVMLELKVMSMQDMVAELYVTDLDNLYLATTSGFSVRLGPNQDIHAKLRATMLTVEQLILYGYSSGTVDVSAPASPSFIPEGGVS